MTDNTQLLSEIHKLLKDEIRSSEARTKKEIAQEIASSEKRLTKVIRESQEDTIEVLSELMNRGFNMHKKRFQTIEKHLNLSSS
jgi:hypothetical protein